MVLPHNRLRQTPNRQSPQPRGPTTGLQSFSKTACDNQTLILKRVLGTTATSNNGLDSLESTNCFAYLAGAVAVVAGFNDDDKTISQRHFRATPAIEPITQANPFSDSPTFFRQGGRRTAAALRESCFGPGSNGSPGFEFGVESPSDKAMCSTERTKALTCLSLSLDGKLLAVGETGRKPRVLIFSLAEDANQDLPLAVFAGHTFGIISLAFSPDSRYLASLGDMNDGFLHVWTVGRRNAPPALFASNKCTSNIKHVAWLGHSLITVGTRHVKVWRVEENYSEVARSPSPSKRSDDSSLVNSAARTLFGRNCLLGPLLNQTFTAVAAISDSKAIISSDEGDVCLLDNSDSIPQLVKVANAGFSINTVTIFLQHHVLIGGQHGRIMCFDLDHLVLQAASPESPLVSGPSLSIEQNGVETAAMVPLKNHFITLNSSRGIYIWSAVSKLAKDLTCTLSLALTAHSAAIKGVQALSPLDNARTSFLTWSAEGLVLFWDSEGVSQKSVKIELEQLSDGADVVFNELKVVQAFETGNYLVSGDRFGVLRIVEVSTQKSIFVAKAHSGEITGIAVYEDKDVTLVVTSARDRTVQLFRRAVDGYHLIQTLDEHVGAVVGVKFTANGKKLVSCSSDRTIIVREALTGVINGRDTTAFLQIHTISLKTSPLSVEMLPNERCLVSTMDRHTFMYDLKTGSTLSSFKTSDSDDGSSVLLSSMVPVFMGHLTLFAGLSSSDKSVRIYNDSGKLLAKGYGHTEAMAGIASISPADGHEGKSLVTVATDGTILIWAVSSVMDQTQEMLATLNLGEDKAGSVEPIATRRPLRRVLSSADIAQLQGLGKEHDGTVRGMPLPRQRRPRKTSSSISDAEAAKPDIHSVRNDRRKTTISDTTVENATARRVTRSQAKTPLSTQQRSLTLHGRPRPLLESAHVQARRKSLSSNEANQFDGLAGSTEHICHELHAYRKKLSMSTDILPLEAVRELERELGSTARVLAEKAARNETAMVKLLDQYSERLVSMLDEKIASSVAREVSKKSGKGVFEEQSQD